MGQESRKALITCTDRAQGGNLHPDLYMSPGLYELRSSRALCAVPPCMRPIFQQTPHAASSQVHWTRKDVRTFKYGDSHFLKLLRKFAAPDQPASETTLRLESTRASHMTWRLERKRKEIFQVIKKKDEIIMDPEKGKKAQPAPRYPSFYS